MLKWNFSGFGNYSESFGWDDGLSCNLTSKAMPAGNEQEGIDVEFSNEYGGSRNVSGQIYAKSRHEALKLMYEYEDSFEVVEYENTAEY